MKSLVARIMTTRVFIEQIIVLKLFRKKNRNFVIVKFKIPIDYS